MASAASANDWPEQAKRVSNQAQVETMPGCSVEFIPSVLTINSPTHAFRSVDILPPVYYPLPLCRQFTNFRYLQGQVFGLKTLGQELGGTLTKLSSFRLSEREVSHPVESTTLVLNATESDLNTDG